MNFTPKRRSQAKLRHRPSSPRVEVLEDRLQPGSLLLGPELSLLGANVGDRDAGLFAPQDEALRVIHRGPDAGELPAVSSSANLAAVLSIDGRREAHGNPSGIVANHDLAGSSALPLVDDLLALSAPGRNGHGVQLSEQNVSRSQVNIPTAAPVTLTSPITRAMTSRSDPTAHQPALTPQVVATSFALPANSTHPVHFVEVSHSTAGERKGPGPEATQNWATYVTGTDTAATGRGVYVDGTGNSYVTGSIDEGSAKIGFVAKYDSSGTRLYFTRFQAVDPASNYISTEGHAITADADGNVYVTGNALHPIDGDTDAFVTKLNPMGEIVPNYGFAIGGPNNDSGDGIAVNAAHEATITGSYKPTLTETDVFAAKITDDGSTIVYARFYELPGATGSSGNAVTLDSSGDNAYVVGSVLPAEGDNDILVMKVNNLTGDPVYSFTKTNTGDDTLNGIAVDESGQAYVAGTIAIPGGTNAYVAKLNADGTALACETTLSNTQTGTGIALDASTGNAYVSGSAVDATSNLHAFVQKFDPTCTPGDTLQITGNATETGSGVGFAAGVAYVVGTTTSSNLATDSTVLNGTSDAFLASVGSFS